MMNKKDEWNSGERYVRGKIPPAARRPKSHKILHSKKCDQTDFLQNVHNLVDWNRLPPWRAPTSWNKCFKNEFRTWSDPKWLAELTVLQVKIYVSPSLTQNDSNWRNCYLKLCLRKSDPKWFVEVMASPSKRVSHWQIPCTPQWWRERWTQGKQAQT